MLLRCRRAAAINMEPQIHALAPQPLLSSHGDLETMEYTLIFSLISSAFAILAMYPLDIVPVSQDFANVNTDFASKRLAMLALMSG